MSDREDINWHPLLALVGTAFIVWFSGGLLGGLLNAVNSYIDPTCFKDSAMFTLVPDLRVWMAAISLGVFEGWMWACFSSLVFTTVVAVTSKMRFSLKTVLPFIAGMIAGVVLCWVIGGLAGLALLSLNDDFYRSGSSPILTYAWVSGSSIGARFGSVLSTMLTSVAFAYHFNLRLSPSP